jgi:hypothetical protein
VFRVTRFRFIPSSLSDDISLDAAAADNFLEASSEVKINNVQQLQEPVASATSVWNCDGEVMDEPAIEFRYRVSFCSCYKHGVHCR